jgi:transposase InsO family protein
MTALSARYGVSRKTAYKWMERFASGGAEALRDQSRRPRSWPGMTRPEVVAAVVALRRSNPAWGGRKLRRRLQDLGAREVPAASTCTAILRRAQLLDLGQEPVRPCQRFERVRPNELWQMDYKGDFGTQSRQQCYPLTVLDDHSRFNLVLAAHGDQRRASVQQALERAFQCYGLPEAILCDNGPPWGQAEGSPYTALTVWLLRLGVVVKHGRPCHPQTQGKDERFHRTLQAELVSRHTWSDLAHCEREFGPYRHRYNCERPHEALGGDTPLTHYQPSPRSMPPALPPIEYGSSFTLRKVCHRGQIGFAGRRWHVGAAFAGLMIGLRPSAQADHQWEVYFSHLRLGSIDPHSPPPTRTATPSVHPSLQ